MVPGLFQGLWSGVSNSVAQTIGGVTHIFDVKSGESGEQRDFEIQQALLKQQQQLKIIIVVAIGIILLVVIVIFGKKKTPKAT